MPASATAKLSPPPYLTDTEQWKRLASSWMRQAAQGNLAVAANVTLHSGTAQTVVTDYRAGGYSFISFMPMTANAASEVAAGTMFVSSLSKGAFTITHANNGGGDRTFTYCILG